MPKGISKPRFVSAFLETENHYSYINLRIQDHENIKAFLPELVRELEELTANRVMRIDETDEHGLVKALYTVDYRTVDPLPPDANLESGMKFFINYRDLVSLVTPRSSEIKKPFLDLLKRRFLDTIGYPITHTNFAGTFGKVVGTWQLKQRQHRVYVTPHTESEGSPIETLLRQALATEGLQFAEQEPVYVDRNVLTVPDFLIKSPLLAIYCDGTEFHKDAARIIKDKQQDRVLQRMGYRVFRFSGSEIVVDAMRCAREIKDFIRILGNNAATKSQQHIE